MNNPTGNNLPTKSIDPKIWTQFPETSGPNDFPKLPTISSRSSSQQSLSPDVFLPPIQRPIIPQSTLSPTNSAINQSYNDPIGTGFVKPKYSVPNQSLPLPFSRVVDPDRTQISSKAPGKQFINSGSIFGTSWSAGLTLSNEVCTPGRRPSTSTCTAKEFFPNTTSSNGTNFIPNWSSGIDGLLPTPNDHSLFFEKATHDIPNKGSSINLDQRNETIQPTLFEPELVVHPGDTEDPTYMAILAKQFENFKLKPQILTNKRKKTANKRCAFCQKNGEDEQIYKSHCLKDENGNTRCPVLRLYICPLCNNKNPDLAHTTSYCPSRREENRRQLRNAGISPKQGAISSGNSNKSPRGSAKNLKRGS